MTADAQPQPYRLTQADLTRIGELLELDDGDFQSEVEERLATRRATPADHAIFESDELIQRTVLALNALMLESENLIKEAGEDRRTAEASRDAHEVTSAKKRIKILTDYQTRIGALRQTYRAVFGDLKTRRRQATTSLEKRAVEELFRRNPRLHREKAAIRRELKQADEDAETAARAAARADAADM